MASSSTGFANITIATNMKRSPLEYNILQQNFISQLVTNMETILLWTQIRDSLGAIPAPIIAQIKQLVIHTMTVVTDFAIAANLTNMSGTFQLGFYYPVYSALNSALYLKMGNDISLTDFESINSATPQVSDANIAIFTTQAIEDLRNYQF